MRIELKRELVCMHRCQAAAKGSAVQTLVAILENVHAYYNQFSPLVDKAIKDSLAPIEKRLEVCILPPSIINKFPSFYLGHFVHCSNLSLQKISPL